ncbi:hypothetical protein [Marisediminitalea sp.]|uniref:hypothetical protein n=1 Tax=Marisediminitalea sp. TaxID=2662268 RepID=UPI003517859E
MKNELLENLKPTFKAYGIVWTGLSAKILIDCYRNNNYSDAIDIFYFLSFVPVIALLTVVYTKLKNSDISNLLSSVIFSLSGVTLLLAFYFLTVLAGGTPFNARFIVVMIALVFACLAGLYYQLPWRKHDVQQPK